MAYIGNIGLFVKIILCFFRFNVYNMPQSYDASTVMPWRKTYLHRSPAYGVPTFRSGFFFSIQKRFFIFRLPTCPVLPIPCALHLVCCLHCLEGFPVLLKSRLVNGINKNQMKMSRSCLSVGVCC